MTRSEPGERAQFSVAELLARYGDEAPTSGRRHRRAQDDGYTAPQSIIERVQTDSGPLPIVDRPRRRRSAEPDLTSFGHSRTDLDEPSSAPLNGHGLPDLNGHSLPSLNGHSRSDLNLHGPGRSDLNRDSLSDLNGPSLPDLHSRGLSDFTSRGLSDLHGRDLPDLNGPGLSELDGPSRSDFTGRDLSDLPGPGLPDLNGRSLPDLHSRGLSDLDGHSAYRASAGVEEDTWVGLPPPGAVPRSRAGTVSSSGPVTEEIPRLDPERLDPAPVVAPRPRSGERPAGLAASPRLVPEQELDGDRAVDDSRSARDGAEPSYDAYDAEDELYQQLGGQLAVDDEDEEPGSPVREWAVMAVQIGVGVLGGAVLWLVCQWLWLQVPALALVVALVVITGLVWVVRRVRRAEDLQTTVIAVLVGLFVTVSPAALLLVGR